MKNTVFHFVLAWLMLSFLSAVMLEKESQKQCHQSVGWKQVAASTIIAPVAFVMLLTLEPVIHCPLDPMGNPL